MKQPATTAAKEPIRPTTPVSMRVDTDHITKLDKLAKSKGITRSSAIQIAIAEFIDRSIKAH